MDKIASRRRFERASLTVPRWCMADAQSLDSGHGLRPPALARDVASSSTRGAPRAIGLQQIVGWTYPLVVKPSDQGSSIGVSLAKTPGELPDAIAAAGHFSQYVLIEEFIQGREVTVGVLGDAALPVIEIKSHQAFFDFTAKYTSGATDYLVPAPLPETIARAIQTAGLKAHRVLGCRHLSRADLMLRADGTPVLLEVNTIPGFTSTSLLPKAAACIGISYEELCERLVLMAQHAASPQVHVSS